MTILFAGHKIHVLLNKLKHNLKVIVDAERLDDFDDVKFMKIQETKTKHLKFYLTKIQVQVSKPKFPCDYSHCF